MDAGKKIKIVPIKNPTPKMKKHAAKIKAALGDMAEAVIPIKKLKREDAEEYHDQESEWEDDEVDVPETDAGHRIYSDFTGGAAKGVAGQTDLTPDQAVLLTQFRILEASYGHLRLGLESFPEWFEVYRLSIGRGSRKETVDMFRGKLEVGPKPEDELRSPNRF